MREVISKAMSSGLDFTRRGALKSFLNKLDIDEGLYDKVYVTIKNMAYEEDFKNTPNKDIIIFLPQCLRNSEECKAEIGDFGYECKRCGSCSISEIIDVAEEKNYSDVFIVPGGSMVRRIAKKYRPRAVVGVACHYELVEAIEFCTIHDIPPQGVPLLVDGCKDTKVDKEKLLEILDK